MTRRTVRSVTSAVATVGLTAAVFLLPATSDRRQARAAIDGITVSAHHNPVVAGAYRD